MINVTVNMINCYSTTIHVHLSTDACADKILNHFFSKVYTVFHDTMLAPLHCKHQGDLGIRNKSDLYFSIAIEAFQPNF